MGQKAQASLPINQAAVHLIRAGFSVSGLTQEGLARATGIPRSTLANILSPTAEPRLIHVEQLVRIVVALGIPFQEWGVELERLEKVRRGDIPDQVKSRRASKTATPSVQKRAARGKAGGSATPSK